MLVLLLVSCVFAGAAAADVPESCNHDTWTKWGDDAAEQTALPTSAGNYYLTADVTLSATWSVPAGETNLCLNGWVIKRATGATGDFSLITVQSDSTLNLYDCDTTTKHYFTFVDNGPWTYEGTTAPSGKTVVDLANFDRATAAGKVIAVTGGCITGGSASNGGGVCVANAGMKMGGTFNMSGGTIVGNTATNGGGVSVKVGTFNMSGGNIVGNSASNGGGGVYVNGCTFTMSGGNIVGNSAANDFGGGVYVDTYGTFILNSGTIVGNSALNGGGGVYVYSDGTFTLNSGSITGNSAVDGGGVCVAGKFTMSGGNIVGNSASGNTATKGGGGVYVSTGTFILNSGTIVGNTATSGGGGVRVMNGTFEVSGAPVIKDNTKTGGTANNVYLSTAEKLKLIGPLAWKKVNDSITPMTPMADIRITSVGGDDPASGNPFGTTTLTKAWEVSPITNDDQNLFGSVSDGILKWVGETQEIPIEGTDITFVAKIGNTEYPTVALAVADAASGDTITMIKNSTEPTIHIYKAVTLDLAGHVLKNDGIGDGDKSVIKVETGGNLTLTDSGSTVEHKFTIGTDGLWIWNDSATEPYETLTGGCITGGIAEAGGGVLVYGSFTMSGGNIVGNGAGLGGGVLVYSGTFNMSGGNIVGNIAEAGGGVCVAGGTFEMKNSNDSSPTHGTITGNSASLGGGVCVSGGTFEMSGTAEITGNSAVLGGGVYVLDGTFTMTDGSIEENTAANGGGVYVNGSTFTMSGGNITGNRATGTEEDPDCGGGVYVYSGTFNVSGSPVISGNKKGTGDTATDNNVYLLTDKTITIGTDGLSGGLIGVTTYTPPTETTPVIITNGYGPENKNYKQYIKSDSTSYNTDDLKNADSNKFAVNLVKPGTVTFDVTYSYEEPVPQGAPAVPSTAQYAAGAEVTVANAPTLSGYTFSGWSTTDVTISGGKFTMPAKAVALKGSWTKNSSGSSTPQGTSTWISTIPSVPGDNTVATDVTYQYTGQKFIPVSAANLEQISAADPAAAAWVEGVLETASAAGIPLTNSKGAKALVNTTESIPGAQTETFAQIIDVKSADGTKVTSVPFKVRLSDLTAKNLTTDDVTLYHYLEEYGLWIPLETGLVSTDDVYAYYEAATDGASPFGVLLKKIDAPEVQPVPTQTGATPAPLMGVIAGLGAALAVFGLRMRRK